MTHDEAGPTTIHLVRHGETVWHHDNRYAGHSDIALTPLGLTQAEHLADWARHRALGLVVSSDLSRCAHTARPAAAAHGLDVVTDRRLREVDFGQAEGLTRAEMATRFPRRLDGFLARPASSPLPGAEAGDAAARRGIEALVAHARSGGEILVVGHSTLFRLMLCELLGIALDDYRTVFPRLENAAVTTIRIPPGWADCPGRAAVALLALNLPTNGRNIAGNHRSSAHP